jgi:hypothetical protein
MYQQVAYQAAAASMGVVPGTSADWTALTTLPASFVKANMLGTNCTVCVANPDTTD